MKSIFHASTFLFVVLIVLMTSSTSQGLICWICSARNHRECRGRGYFEECFSPRDEMICATEVKRNNGRIMGVQKQCKQKSACITEQNQNWGSGATPGQCRLGSSTSTCRCCCFEDFCSRRETCEKELRPSCRTIPPMLRGGEVQCSNENQVGSICNFTCPSQHEGNNINLMPSYSDVISCLPSGKWNQPIPNCREQCPPTVKIDLTAITHRHTEELTIRRIQGTVKAFFLTANLGDNSLRYSRFHYDERIHNPILHFNDSINFTRRDIFNFLDDIPIHEERFPGTNTGAAMRYVYNNMIGQEGDRPDVKNVFLIDTDENADDDVITPARALRAAGVVIVPLMHPRNNMRVNVQELDAIAGYRSRWRIGGSRIDDISSVTDMLCRLSYPVLV